MAGFRKFSCPYCDYIIVPKKPIKTAHIECRKCHKPVRVCAALVRRSWGNFLTLCIWLPTFLGSLVFSGLKNGFLRTFDFGVIILALVLAFIFSVFTGQILGLIIGNIKAKKMNLT